MNPDDPDDPDEIDGLRARVRTVMNAHWRSEGYTAPNPATYPFQWLWDSCFHAIIWAHLGEGERAAAELAHVFRTQDDDGFVPHIDYGAGPAVHAGFWGRAGSSSLTQPPMYGVAVSTLVAQGVAVPDGVVEAAASGLRFLLRRRRRHPSGLVPLCHPWEAGCDDSPRWDHWFVPADGPAVRYRVKGELLAGIVRSESGGPIANPAFDCAPAGFNALIALHQRRLAAATGEGGDDADELVEALAPRWDVERRTWIDAGDGESSTGAVRTLDALLAVLVTGLAPAAEAVHRDLVDPAAYGGRFGPAGVHRAEPSFEPGV
ncbi:hypothetical protein BH18ACT4_BH18ACT4_09150 [soil metagenome]